MLRLDITQHNLTLIVNHGRNSQTQFGSGSFVGELVWFGAVCSKTVKKYIMCLKRTFLLNLLFCSFLSGEVHVTKALKKFQLLRALILAHMGLAVRVYIKEAGMIKESKSEG